jgi:hypothetical protein
VATLFDLMADSSSSKTASAGVEDADRYRMTVVAVPFGNVWVPISLEEEPVDSLSKRLLALVVFSVSALLSVESQEKPKDPQPGAASIEASKVDPSTFPVYTKWLDQYGVPPLEYILKKAKEHQVVVLGEYHLKKDFLDLLNKAIPDLYKTAGVRVLALEVCNQEDDANLEKLVNADQYDRTLALEIARHENWEIWGYKGYWDLLEAVWRLNHSLPKQAARMRVIGIDKRMDYQLDALWRQKQITDPALIEKAKSQPDIYKRDDWMAKNIDDGILGPGLKGIVLIGLNHSFTKYAQPVLKDGKLDREWPRTSSILHQKYGDKIFQIAAHGVMMSPGVVDKEYKGSGPVLPSVVEKIMSARGDKPVGFDVAGSPFANLRDSESYYFRWQPKVTFADVCEGYVFLKAEKDLASTPWIEGFISDEMFQRSQTYYELTYQRKFANAKEVDDFFKAALGTP